WYESFFFQAEDGIRDFHVTGVQTCALPIFMARVKRGDVRFLVATDLAARGIDISDLSHVINYSLPEDPAVYLHRVGRTGRIGKTGTAISLAGGRDLLILEALRGESGPDVESASAPAAADARR